MVFWGFERTLNNLLQHRHNKQNNRKPGSIKKYFSAVTIFSPWFFNANSPFFLFILLRIVIAEWHIKFPGFRPVAEHWSDHTASVFIEPNGMNWISLQIYKMLCRICSVFDHYFISAEFSNKHNFSLFSLKLNANLKQQR